MNPTGPSTAKIVILTDYPSSQEKLTKAPLSDYSGGLFFGIAGKCGILKNDVLIIPLLDEPPPEDTTGKPDFEKLLSKRKTCPGPEWRNINGKWVAPALAEGAAKATKVLAEVSPSLVIAMGDAALWALTGDTGVTKWRGSRLSPPQWPFTVVPMLPHRTLSLIPESKVSFQLDLNRVKNIYEGTQLPRHYRFKIAPTYSETVETLLSLLAKAEKGHLRITGDLETRGGHIACLGIAWSAEDAICIPFITTNDASPFYWTVEEETDIIALVAQVFMHPNIESGGQNYLYDCQYYWRHWGFLPSSVRDTMVGHHSLYSNLRKGLDYLSSMYAQDHIYWKDEIKEWDPTIGEKQYWIYNCKDACITWEIWPEVLSTLLNAPPSPENDRWQNHFSFQQRLFFPVLRMMNRGIRIDTSLREEIRLQLIKAGIDRQEKLEFVVSHPLNVNSSTQLKKLFYDDLKLPAARNFKTGNLTADANALALFAQQEPMLKPLCQLIVELRSIGVFLHTFVEASLDSDGRMRCSFSIAGPITFRFASSENAFNSGMNLQNIPVAEKQKIKDKNYISLPNIRKLFIPDPGYTYFDMDLDRADLQVVVWEADDSDLKKALHLGIDMHCMNACDVFGIKGIPYDELTESHPNYSSHRAKIGETNRGKTKAGVHATNYGVGDRKLAQTLGISVHEAGAFRAKWFGAHPGVRKWHTRTEQAVSQSGYLENKFGARLYNFGRFDLPEFLGWLPQSTVAGVINRALVNIDAAAERGETSVQLQIQVHDSLAGQFLSSRKEQEIMKLRELSRVVVPYDDPLIIPVGFKTSEKSWGDCK